MKKVMLLGDSIRMGYQDEVIRLLDGCSVWKPEENCRFAKYTLNSLRFWLNDCPKPDIIHWNNGIWDIKRLYDWDESFSSVEEYLHDMERVLKVLRSTGARIVFAATTPVRDGAVGLDNGTISKYNEAIARLMTGEGIPVNDLYSVVYPSRDQYIVEDLVHLSEPGIAACAKAVAHAVKKALL